MRLFGYDFTAARAASPVVSLFGGAPVDVSKAVDLPPGGSINAAGTERARGYANSLRVGSSIPALGVRPDPGMLPDATAEATADPLRFQFLWGTNLTYTPRTGFGTPFSVLRGLASASPAIALCIQCRKDQMSALDWDFAPKDKKARGAGIDAQLAKARTFFAKPDGRRPFKSWLQMLVDDILTIDAAAIYRHPTNKGAAKQATDPAYVLQPDEIAAYELIDGATIKILLDERGEVPLPPQIGYRQIVYGVPMRGGDLTANQLLYRPKTERTWTPYGLSPIEAALLIVTADLNRAMFNLSYYTDGNVPEGLVGVPNSWGPKQISQWQQYWDLLLAGDPKNRSRLRFVVETMAKNVHEFRKPDFTTQYDLWLLKLQCACFGVTPSEIGFTDDVNKATSKSQGDVNQRRGVKPMANFLKALVDEMLAEIGVPDVETTWSGGEGEDALTQAKIIDIGLRNGRYGLDEVRAQDGNPTLGAGPAVYGAAGLQFVEDAIAASEAAGVLDTGGEDDPDIDAPPPAADAVPTPAPSAKALAIDADLKKYCTVALKAVKKGRPVPAFHSAVLPASLQTRLSRALATADTSEAVKAAFASVRKAQRLSAAQKKHEAQMKAKLTAILADERAAFARHVAAGLEARA